MKVPTWITVAGALVTSAWLVLMVGDLTFTLDTPWLWWTARALGLVSWFALWMTMMLGVMVASRSSWIEPPMVMALHQQWALCALLATGGHVLLVVADGHGAIPALSAIVPFVSAKMTGPVALGTLALWSIGGLVGTTLLRPRVPPQVWRAIHGTAFGGWVLAVVHAVTAGSDTGWWPIQIAWVTANVLLIGATLHRIEQALSDAAPRSAPDRRATPT